MDAMGRASRASTAERVGVLAIGLAVLAATCCVWAWMSYSYVFGTHVSVSIDTDCLASLQDDRVEMLTCSDSSWTIDGAQHDGRLLDYGRSNGPFEFDAVKARAVGDTARTLPPTLVFVAGLAGPPLLVVAGVTYLAAVRRARPKRVVRLEPAFV